MKSIWKFLLNSDSTTILLMPKDAKILSIQIQNDRPVMWVMVDTDSEFEKRRFEPIMTGQEFEINRSDQRYIGTYQMLRGMYVVHVFEMPF